MAEGGAHLGLRVTHVMQRHTTYLTASKFLDHPSNVPLGDMSKEVKPNVCQFRSIKSPCFDRCPHDCPSRGLARGLRDDSAQARCNGLRHFDVLVLKPFFSRPFDRRRAPFGRSDQQYRRVVPRSEWLSGPTGVIIHRRARPVGCLVCEGAKAVAHTTNEPRPRSFRRLNKRRYGHSH